MSIAVEIDDFDLFMLHHSLEFRKVVDGYLDYPDIDGEAPSDELILDRARVMQSFITFTVKQRGLNPSE